MSALANVTTAFTAKFNLFTLLEDTFASDSYTVYYGHPGESPPDTREWCWVGEIEWELEEARSQGGGRRDEIYRIVVTMESHVPDDNQLEANNRVRDKMYVIEEALRVGPGKPNPLAIPNPIAVGIEPQFLGEGGDASGRGAILVLTVRVEARK